jgi:hypothetical protein
MATFSQTLKHPADRTTHKNPPMFYYKVQNESCYTVDKVKQYVEESDQSAEHFKKCKPICSSSTT